MEIGEFENKYKDYNWIYLLKNPIVREFVSSYNITKTQITLMRGIYDIVTELRKDKEDFDISELLSLNPIEARKLIWKAVQGLMGSRGESNRVAEQAKVFVSLLYAHANEELGKTIVWKRKHRVPIVSVKDKQVPTHEEVWELVDSALHLRDKCIFALSYNSGLKSTPIVNLKVKDLRKQLEDFKENGEVPLILKITARIYPKRFQSNNLRTWYPSLVDRDCANLLLKYYESERKNAKDNEPFFVTYGTRKLGDTRISRQFRYLADKLYEHKGILGKHCTAMHLRDSFFNRLVQGNMKDIYREFLMMHSLGIKAHYFNWELEKEEIIKSYLKCNFNRETNQVRKTVEKQQTEIEQLKKQIAEQQKIIDLLKERDVFDLLKKIDKIAPKEE